MNSTFDLATALLEKGRYEAASRKYTKLLKEGVTSAEVYLNLGNCYRSLGLESKAAAAYFSSLAAKNFDGSYTPSLAENNIGLHYYTIGDDATAIKWFAKAAKHGALDANWNMSTAVLRTACSGRVDMMQAGWDLYESRFEKATPTGLRIDVDVPLWRGEKCSRIVVLAEQGIGDQFMFGRYLNALEEFTGAKVIVQCAPSLEPIFVGFETCQFVSTAKADYAVPMCSLARAFWDTGVSGSWLSGLFRTRSFNEDDFNIKDDFNIGVVWAGSSTHANDKFRSVLPGRFARLARLEGVKLWSFQGGAYNNLGCKTWTDTLEAINGLDLVISVDTSIVHACGSLNRPCWVLMPSQETDFRWGSKGSTNPWYSSVKVYRNDNDWNDVFNTVVNDVKKLVCLD